MRWLLALVLVVAACGDDAPPAADDAGALLDAGPDPSDPLFAPDHLVEVEITLDPADWDALRLQTRSVSQIFGTCLMEPFADPFTYFPASVTIDGQAVAQARVRKKGFLGSLDEVKPSLKLKFGEGFAGLETFTLNNSKQDPAFVRQCLAYRTFAAAGIPATRCNFAHVTVNGQDLGLYVHVESGNQAFVDRHFVDPTGNLYEGTLSDFRQGWTATFELKTNEDVGDRSDLQPVVDALALPDDQLLGALEPLVDVDQFLRFWATEVLVTHWDGYSGNANNFFAYHDPVSGKFVFMPWGADGTFIAGPAPFGEGLPVSVQATSLLARRLYLLPETRDRYVATLRQLLDTVWNETLLQQEIDRMETLIATVQAPVDLDAVRAFVRDRRAAINLELASGPPAWTTPLRDAPCFVTIGSLEGSLATTWGTIGAPDPFITGSGTLSGELGGVAIAPTMVGSTAGLNSDGEVPRAQVAVVAWLPDQTAELVVFQLDPGAFVPDSDHGLDFARVFGVVYHFTPATSTFELVGLFSDGNLHLDAASTTDGQPVSGSFSGSVIESPF